MTEAASVFLAFGQPSRRGVQIANHAGIHRTFFEAGCHWEIKRQINHLIEKGVNEIMDIKSIIPWRKKTGTGSAPAGGIVRSNYPCQPLNVPTKSNQFRLRGKWFAAGVLALVLAVLVLLGGATRLLATDSQGDSASFLDQVQKWENEMTDKFRDTFRDIRARNKENSIGSASVDLREQKDNYMVRLNLPGRDLSKVEISLEGSSLHVVAPAGANAGRYEQSIDLPDAAVEGKLVIDRNQTSNLIVVTIPKGPATAKSEASPFGLAPSPLSDWDREMFDRMRKMQDEMDRVFDDSFRQFQNEPDFKGFFDEPRFGSSIDLQDEGGSYVVKAYLPNRDMQNVSVTLNNQTLQIEAKAQDRKEDEKSGGNIIHEAEYSQAVALPGPVNAGEMKVDKKEGMLVITLPKAGSK